MELKDKLKDLRLKHNMTQDEAAERLGVSAQTVSKWERGVFAPDISLLPKIAVMYRCSIDSLFNMQSCWDEEHQKEFSSKLQELNREGKFEEAYALTLEEIELNPDNFSLYPGVMWLVFKRKMFDDAHVARILQLAKYAERYCDDKEMLNEIIIHAARACFNAKNPKFKQNALDFYEKLPTLPQCREIHADFAMEGEELIRKRCSNILWFLSYAQAECKAIASSDIPQEEKLYFRQKALVILELISDGKYSGVMDAEIMLACRNAAGLCLSLGKHSEAQDYMERIFALIGRRINEEERGIEQRLLFCKLKSELSDPPEADISCLNMLKNMSRSALFSEWKEQLSDLAYQYEKYLQK